MFLLQILCKLCVDGKQVSIILRNLAPILVDTLAEKGGVEPGYVAAPGFLSSQVFCILIILQYSVIATISEGILVGGDCFIKDPLIFGNAAQPLVNTCRYILYDIGRVVAVFVDI